MNKRPGAEVHVAPSFSVLPPEFNDSSIHLSVFPGEQLCDPGRMMFPTFRSFFLFFLVNIVLTKDRDPTEVG